MGWRNKKYFYSRPCGRGDTLAEWEYSDEKDFYSRPCGRGDVQRMQTSGRPSLFLLTPLREGRQTPSRRMRPKIANFYSRPCGRGDRADLSCREIQIQISTHAPAGGATRKHLIVVFHTTEQFLLTPLREGRHGIARVRPEQRGVFLLTPLREGRLAAVYPYWLVASHFYSRPCGRGDSNFPQVRHEVLRQIAER